MNSRTGQSDFLLQCFVRTVGAIVMTLGLTVLFGWSTNNLTLMRVLPSSVVMKANTAFGLALCGATILCLHGKVRPVAFAGAFSGFLLGLLTLLEHLFSLDLGIDQMLLADYVSGQALFPGRMAFVTACEFMLIGSALLVLSASRPIRRRPLIAGILGGVSAALALAALAEYFLGTPSAAVSNGLVKMAVHTAIGFSLLGLGILADAWREYECATGDGAGTARRVLPRLLLSRWLGITLAMTIVQISLAIWRSLILNEHTLITQSIAAEAENVAQRVDEQALEEAQSLIRLSRQWEIYGTPTARQWDTEASLTLHDFSGFSALSFVADDNRVHLIVPREGNEHAIGFDVSVDPDRRATYAAARSRQTVQISPPLELAIGGHGFLLCAPIVQHGRHVGFISGICRSDAFFEAILRRIDTEGYSLAITDAGANVYSDDSRTRRGISPSGADKQQLRAWEQTRLLPLFGREWRLTVRPTQHLLMAEQSMAPEAALGLGIVVAALAFLLANFAQTAYHRAADLGRANAQLADEIALRQCQEIRLESQATELKTQAAELQKQAVELRRSNIALQEFASIASHDLKEPLRKIQMFGAMLNKKAAASLEPTHREYLDRITGAANRMTLLIDGLLDYSRIASKERDFIPVDLNRIADEVVSDLEVRIAEVGGDVVIETLPTLLADPLQMRQLLQNLLSNALKFRREGVPPHVEVAAQSLNDQRRNIVRITVSDNGIGFASEYAERIFGVFERLETSTRFEGSGIGLAICRKIVERHGGTIVADSIEGTGTTFVIDFPEQSLSGYVPVAPGRTNELSDTAQKA